MSEAAILLDPETERSARSLADAKDRSLEWIIREAVALYAERERVRADARSVALDRWRQFETDGLHAPGEAVDAWLEALENGGDAAVPPACRD